MGQVKRQKDKTKLNKQLKKYGQVKLRAAKRGIYSCLFAIGGIICQILLLAVAYYTYGEAPMIIGSVAFIMMIIGVMGIVYGVQGFREREKSYKACKVGIVLNGMLILIFILLFVRGLL